MVRSLFYFSCIYLYFIFQGKNHDIPLKTLVLNGCSSLSDELISQISRVLFNLQELDLSSCLHVTDIGLSAITGSLINLHSLRLSWCVNITDNGLIGFVQSERNLAHVCYNKEKCSHAEKFRNDVNHDASQVYILLFTQMQGSDLPSSCTPFSQAFIVLLISVTYPTQTASALSQAFIVY